MKLRILILTLCLLIPISAFAQKATTQAAASKSWAGFWTQFSAAVGKRNKAAVKRLMAPEDIFFSGGGGESRDEWLQLADEQKWWGLLKQSVKLGTKPYNYENKPGRVTKNNHLIFAYLGGKWRFVGPMGD